MEPSVDKQEEARPRELLISFLEKSKIFGAWQRGKMGNVDSMVIKFARNLICNTVNITALKVKNNVTVNVTLN